MLHKHALRGCRGTLTATAKGVEYRAEKPEDNAKDGFTFAFGQFASSLSGDSLTIKARGKTYNFKAADARRQRRQGSPPGGRSTHLAGAGGIEATFQTLTPSSIVRGESTTRSSACRLSMSSCAGRKCIGKITLRQPAKRYGVIGPHTSGNVRAFAENGDGSRSGDWLPGGRRYASRVASLSNALGSTTALLFMNDVRSVT